MNGAEEGYYPTNPYLEGGDVSNVANVLGQIDPNRLVQKLNHILKGEIYDDVDRVWKMIEEGKPLVNDSCRKGCISFVTSFLSNNTTMTILQPQQINNIMTGVIRTVRQNFIQNLEEYGFQQTDEEDLRMGTMSMVATLTTATIFFSLSRATNGMESNKIFKSLSMSDSMSYVPQQKKGLMSRIGGMFK